MGEDQVPHVELTREVARRFNQFYPAQAPARMSDEARKREGSMSSPSRKPLLTPTPKLPGTDGRKMSKSYGNTILLSEPEASLRQKLKTMVTDPARIRRTDPGDPDKCPVGDLHKIFSTRGNHGEGYEGCRTAGIGCIECKRLGGRQSMEGAGAHSGAARQVRSESQAGVGYSGSGIGEGARSAAEATMREVRDATNLSYEYEAPTQAAGEGK